MSSLGRKERAEPRAVNGVGPATRPPCVSAGGGGRPLKERLQGITTAMTWIKEELVELKESDRALMKIFKQLEGDVSEMTDMFSWRLSSASNYKHNSLRPQSMESFSNLEFVSHDPAPGSRGSTLTSSKEELAAMEASATAAGGPKPASSSTHGSDSLLTTDGSPGPATKNSSSGSPSPPLKGSASLSKIANSPSIQRIQDNDSSSNISRNSSIDSGIQFEHEHVPAAAVAAVAPEPSSMPSLAAAEDTDGLGTSFANDIFKSLGFS